MKNISRHIALFFWIIITCFPTLMIAQTEPADTSNTTKVDIDHSDYYNYVQEGDSTFQYLQGNVELKQDSLFMYCDTAIIKNGRSVIADGHVIIQQGDTLSIFSDSLFYDGKTKKAILLNDVALLNGNQKLFTERLDYDANTKVATYFSGATLTNDTTQLTSKIGYYYVDEDIAYFKDSVVVVDSQFVLRSDTLKFNTATRVVTFLGPTIISSDSSKIYCEAGFYDMRQRVAEFEENAQYVKGDQTAIAEKIKYNGNRNEYTLEGDAEFRENERIAKADFIIYNEKSDITTLKGKARYKDEQQDIVADEIIYDGKKEVYSTRGRSLISDPPQLLEADEVDYSEELGLGIASGNVIWQDTSADLTIVCEKADYNRKTNYLKASGGRGGRPLLITLIDGDSLYMASDTLLSIKEDSLASDSIRTLIAYNDVRVFKTNLQAICDSLTYSSEDSLFRFYVDPIIWSDTSQFKADTIHMQMDSGKVDQIFLYENAFIINSPDELFFNQIKGKNIIAHFLENELRRMEVLGNAESVYYAQDEAKAYVGVNKTVCSEMTLYFGNNQVERIKFFEKPQAKMHPMTQVNHGELKIPGFLWEIEKRPDSIDDLFTPKRAVAVKVDTEIMEMAPEEEGER